MSNPVDRVSNSTLQGNTSRDGVSTQRSSATDVAQRNIHREAPQVAPRQPVQNQAARGINPALAAPLGLPNMGRNQCWGNAFLQVVFNSPLLFAHFIEGLQGLRGNEAWNQNVRGFKDYARAYREVQAGTTPARNVDLTRAAELLRALVYREDRRDTQDPHEAQTRLAHYLLSVNNPMGFTYAEIRQVDLQHPIGGHEEFLDIPEWNEMHGSGETASFLEVNMHGMANLDLLENLIDSAVDSRPRNDDPWQPDASNNAYRVIRIRKQLQTTPQILQIHINRTARAHIDVPFTYYTPANLTTSGAAVKYELQSAIISRPGHYIAVVKKGNQWFLCNDSTVTPIDAATVQRDLASGAHSLFYENQGARSAGERETHNAERLEANIAKREQATQWFGGFFSSGAPAASTSRIPTANTPLLRGAGKPAAKKESVGFLAKIGNFFSWIGDALWKFLFPNL